MAPFTLLRCHCVSFLVHTNAIPTSSACLQGEVISLLLRFKLIYRSQLIWCASTSNIFMYSMIHWVIQRQQHNVRQRTHQWNKFKIQLKKITSIIAKSLRISIPIRCNKEIVLRVWQYNCITLGVNLINSDWWVLWQATIAHIADIRHRWVTNMSGVINKERLLRRIRENGGGTSPLWALYPMLPYTSCKANIYCYFTVNVCNKHLVILNISFVSHTAIEMVQ